MRKSSTISRKELIKMISKLRRVVETVSHDQEYSVEAGLVLEETTFVDDGRPKLRACEACSGPGPCLMDIKTGRYSCVKCHSEPHDRFFVEHVGETKALCTCEGTGYCDCEAVTSLRAETDHIAVQTIAERLSLIAEIDRLNELVVSIEDDQETWWDGMCEEFDHLHLAMLGRGLTRAVNEGKDGSRGEIVEKRIFSGDDQPNIHKNGCDAIIGGECRCPQPVKGQIGQGTSSTSGDAPTAANGEMKTTQSARGAATPILSHMYRLMKRRSEMGEEAYEDHLRAEVDRLHLAMLGRGISQAVLAGWLESAEQDVCDAEAGAEASEADLSAMTGRAERAEAMYPEIDRLQDCVLILQEKGDTLRAALAAAEREIARLREGVECHVARPGEGTYECRVDAPCPACRLREAERERDEEREKARKWETSWKGTTRRRITDSAEVQRRLAAEKERAERAEAELADGAMRRAFDKIADYVCPGWEYPGQVVRAVIEEDEQ